MAKYDVAYLMSDDESNHVVIRPRKLKEASRNDEILAYKRIGIHSRIADHGDCVRPEIILVAPKDVSAQTLHPSDPADCHDTAHARSR
jgi:hypothetical protein